jgi:hypothetical protein
MANLIAGTLACSFILGGQAFGQDTIKIALIDAEGKTVKESLKGKLELDHGYVKGDRIVISGDDWLDSMELVVKVDEHYAETILYAPKKTVPDRPKIEFPIPLWLEGWHNDISPYPPKAFKGKKHIITARPATRKEINAYRNLALNPMDHRGISTYFPHATSNSEWGDAALYAARNAIDGFVEATGDHHTWPRQSWGPYRPADHPDPQLMVEFGRPVEIDKLVVVVRHNDNQSNHWKDVTVEFSDGSTVEINPKYSGDRQEFPIKKRVVTGMRFCDLGAEVAGGYAAFIEVEAWGKPAE